MRIASLQLQNYRNLEPARIKFSPRLNILVGDNGQGKTNTLEALYLLTQGESFRQGENSTLIRDGASEAFLEITAVRRQLEFQIRLQLLKTRKNLWLNGKKSTYPEIRRLFPSVIFSPESLAAIKEGADLRRSLIDHFLITHHPPNAQLIADYRRALKSRNRLLREAQNQPQVAQATRAVLESLDVSFLKLAGALTEARAKALRDIRPEFSAALRALMKDAVVDISVEYLLSGTNAVEWDRSQIDAALHQRADELREAELSSGVSLVGPHKHDIVFLYNQKDSRFYCSQGQQRAIILSFKMAQIVYHRRVHGIYPVLMLDDVLSELDSAKRAALISFLHEIQTQVFLTTTEISSPDIFSLDPSLDSSAVFQVRQGLIAT